jgi:hypothetical protein
MSGFLKSTETSWTSEIFDAGREKILAKSSFSMATATRDVEPEAGQAMRDGRTVPKSPTAKEASGFVVVETM